MRPYDYVDCTQSPEKMSANFAQQQARGAYSISRTGFWNEAPAAASTMSPPASRNMSFKLQATRNPATASEIGVIPTEASMSTLATRPRTATSIRCIAQAPMWTLTNPAATPMTSNTPATLQTLYISPMEPRQRPNTAVTRRIMTPRLRIFHTPASSAPSKLPAARAEIAIPYAAGEPNLVFVKYARPIATGPAMQKFMIVAKN